MKDPKIQTRVKHSESKSAWNVVGNTLGGKYKIARVPYFKSETNDDVTETFKNEAKHHAELISFCFNNSDWILSARGLMHEW